MSLVPAHTQVPNIIIDRYMNHLTDTEFRILMIIVRKTFGWIEDPKTGMRKQEDWISRSQLQEFSGRHTQAVSAGIQKLQTLGLIEIRDAQGIKLMTPQERRGKRLFYRFTTSMIIKQVNPNMFENQSLIIKHTKETYTKTLSKDKDSRPSKEVSCPLNDNKNSNPLKGKYPRGHIECAEYITGFKFINKPKQFRFLHQMLRSGLDFPDIDRVLAIVEKKPYFKENGFDMATIASEAERRSNAIT